MRKIRLIFRALFTAAAFICVIACASCAKEKQKDEPVYDHIHAYEQAWSKDENGHWHKANCGHGVTADWGLHDFSEDGVCGICGYLCSVPTEPPDDNPPESPSKPEPPEEKPEEKPDGDDKPDDEYGKADALILEGIEELYRLSKDFKEVDVGGLNIAVYLGEGGIKGKKLSAGEYEISVSKGGQPVVNIAKITEEGDYVVKVTATGKKIYATATFTVSNPFVSIKLISGKTEQVVSSIDKMSAQWRFCAVRANGEEREIDAREVAIAALDTREIGKRTAEFRWGDIVGGAEYSILPVPEAVTGFTVTPLATEVETEDSGYAFTADDFTVKAETSVEYSLSVSLESEGEKTAKYVCPSDGVSRTVTVVAEYSFTVEDEVRVKIFRKDVTVKVNKKAPPPDGDFEIAEGQFGNWVPDIVEATVKTGNSLAEISLSRQELFTVGCNDGALTVTDASEYGGNEYTGLCVTLEKAGRVTLTLSVQNCEYALICVDESDDLREIGAEKSQLGFDLTAGRHVFSFVTEPGGCIIVSGVKIAFVAE